MTASKGKGRQLGDVIRRATQRGLARVASDDTGRVDGWAPFALMTWVAPVIIRAVKRHLDSPPPKKRKPRKEAP